MAEQQILLFTKTTGYRHDSIEVGVDLVLEHARQHGIGVERTEDAAAFTPRHLSRFDAVVWVQTSGDVLDDAGRAAFAAYLRAGGGFAGIHAAADSEWHWPEYESIVGARFVYHPGDALQRQRASVIAEIPGPSTDAIPADWSWSDEWYSFNSNPRGEFEVLLRVDEATYNPDERPMGPDHPVSWRGRYGEGRTWYTALGHYIEDYTDPVFRAHIWGGITSVLR